MNPADNQANPNLDNPATAGGTPPEPDTANLDAAQTNPVVPNLPTISTADIPPAPIVKPEPPKPKNPNFDFQILSKQWTFWGMVGCAVLALAASILSLVLLLSENAVTEKASDLQAELDEANELLVKYGVMLGIKVNEFGRPVAGTEVDPEKTTIASPDYVYIGEWGIKIKIPKELEQVSYSFNNTTGKEDEPETSTFCVTGVPASADHTPAYIGTNTKLGCLTRYEKGKVPESQDKPVYQNDKYEFVYSAVQQAADVTPNEDGSETPEDQEGQNNQDNQTLATEAIKLVQNMLSSDNISTF